LAASVKVAYPSL